MTAQVGDQRYRIVFRHQHHGYWGEDKKFVYVYKSLPDTNGLRSRVTTTCRILQGEPGEEQEIAQGVAECSDKDNFDKEAGRQLALDRATKGMLPEYWGAIRHAYFSRRRG